MKRWQKLFWISATVLAIVSLASVLARPAIAQIRAAVVKNIDEKGRIAYLVSSTCTANTGGALTTCTALFPIVPADKRLVIEYVNGEFNVGPGLSPAAALINLTTSAGYALPTFSRFANNYGVSSPVLIYLEAGQQAAFTAFGPSGNAHVTGYLVDLKQ